MPQPSGRRLFAFQPVLLIVSFRQLLFLGLVIKKKGRMEKMFLSICTPISPRVKPDPRQLPGSSVAKDRSDQKRTRQEVTFFGFCINITQFDKHIRSFGTGRLRVKATQLFDVPRIVKLSPQDVADLVSAWPDHLQDAERAFPLWSQLVALPGWGCPSEDEVSYNK